MGTCQNINRDHPWRGMGKVRNSLSVFNTCFTAKFKKKKKRMCHLKRRLHLPGLRQGDTPHVLTILKFSWAFFSVPQFGAHIRERHVQAGLPGLGCSPGIRRCQARSLILTAEALPHGPHSPEKAVSLAKDILGKLRCGKQGIRVETHAQSSQCLYRTRLPVPDHQKHPHEPRCSALQPLPDTFLSSVLGNFLCLL